MKAITYTRTGTKTTDTTLSKGVFESEVSQDLLKQAALRAQANLRHAGAKTLTRGEVRGGGKKPWRQKGTGRARFGSSRVNIWRHGGVAHGPNGLQNYQKDMPKNMIKASIRMALSANAKNIRVIEEFKLTQAKTQLASKLLQKLDVSGNVLLVCAQPNESLARACANLPQVMVVNYSQLRSYDIMVADNVVIEKSALSAIDTWLKGDKK